MEKNILRYNIHICILRSERIRRRRCHRGHCKNCISHFKTKWCFSSERRTKRNVPLACCTYIVCTPTAQVCQFHFVFYRSFLTLEKIVHDECSIVRAWNTSDGKNLRKKEKECAKRKWSWQSVCTPQHWASKGSMYIVVDSTTSERQWRRHPIYKRRQINRTPNNGIHILENFAHRIWQTCALFHFPFETVYGPMRIYKWNRPLKIRLNCYLRNISLKSETVCDDGGQKMLNFLKWNLGFGRNINAQENKQ